MSSEDICEVVITGPSSEWLADFTRRLVESRLAACGQSVSPIRSIYRWRGAVEDEPEARVALHTRVGLVPPLPALSRAAIIARSPFPRRPCFATQ